MNDTIWDVIVVGLGPSGASAARILAGSGLKVLGLDRAVFPRPKPCAAGLTARSVKEIGDFPDDLKERTLRQACISNGAFDGIRLSFDSPVMLTTDRSALDMYLFEQARASGARLVQNALVRKIIQKEDLFCVEADRIYRTRWLLGCDGANGICSRFLDPSGFHPFLPALECEIRISDANRDYLESHFIIDIGLINQGYAWSFPKKDHLSVGLSGRLTSKADCWNRLEKFIRITLGIRSFEYISKSAHPIPQFHSRRMISAPGFLLCGDSAGLVDAFMGEGIFSALISGRKAAEAIIRNWNCPPEEISHYYRESIHRRLFDDLSLSGRLAFWVYHFPKFFFHRASKNPGVLMKYGNCLRMENGYRAFINQLPWKYRLLFAGLN